MQPVGILLIDDRLKDLEALELVLARPDYRFVRAQSGEEALRRLLEDDYACILLDVIMPGIGGAEDRRHTATAHLCQNLVVSQGLRLESLEQRVLD